MALLLLTILGILGGVFALDPNSLCDQLLTVNCSSYLPGELNEMVCGTDKKEYMNFCEFSKARCYDHTIDIFLVGSCTPPSTTAPVVTTQAASTSAPGSSPVATTAAATTAAATTQDPTIAVFCSHKDNLTCPAKIDLTCGSDKKLYRNSCSLAKAHCDDPTLHKVDISFCRS